MGLAKASSVPFDVEIVFMEKLYKLPRISYDTNTLQNVEMLRCGDGRLDPNFYKNVSSQVHKLKRGYAPYFVQAFITT